MHLKTMGGRKESDVYLRKRSVRLKEWCQIKDGFTLLLSRNIEFRDLWLCDFMTSLSVFVSVKVSHKQLLKYFILVTSETHVRYWFKNRTIFSSLFFEQQYISSAQLYNLTSGEPHVIAKFLTRCLFWHSLEAGKLESRKTGRYGHSNFQSFLF